METLENMLASDGKSYAIKQELLERDLSENEALLKQGEFSPRGIRILDLDSYIYEEKNREIALPVIILSENKFRCWCSSDKCCNTRVVVEDKAGGNHVDLWPGPVIINGISGKRHLKLARCRSDHKKYFFVDLPPYREYDSFKACCPSCNSSDLDIMAGSGLSVVRCNHCKFCFILWLGFNALKRLIKEVELKEGKKLKIKLTMDDSGFTDNGEASLDKTSCKTARKKRVCGIEIDRSGDIGKS